jgi:rhodanese-related sulfurtransferase
MKWMIAGAVLLLVFLALKARGQSKVSGFEEIDGVQFNELRNQADAVVIDVRTPRETASGKVEGAIEIDALSSSFKSQLGELDPEKTYLIYCRSGNRSRKACSELSKMGFEKVYNVSGGFRSIPK